MKYKYKLITILVFILFTVNILPTITFSQQYTPTLFYVAQYGNDSNKGTIDKPFKTVEGARDYIRKIPSLPNGGITVYIREGVYYLDHTFQLNSTDSGTVHCPIKYCGYPNENVEFTGSKIINTSKMTNVTNSAIINKLPQNAVNSIKQIDLPSQGITNYGTLERFGMYHQDTPAAPELFVNDLTYTLARWPNKEYTQTQKVIDGGTKDYFSTDEAFSSPDYVPPDQYVPRGATFSYSQPQPSRWSGATDGWLYGFWEYEWCDDAIKIASIDTINKTITTQHATAFGVSENKRFYAFNLIEELDAPGEWYLDRNTGILYVYLMDNAELPEMKLSLTTDTLVKLQNTQYITIENINIGATRGNGVEIINGKNNEIRGSSVYKTGQSGIIIQNGNYNGVKDCHIYDIGTIGIQISGGNEKTLAHSYNYVDNCHIHNFSRRVQTVAPGIKLHPSVGAKVSNNRINNAPGIAISIYGMENLVENNEIFDVLSDTNDGGAIYAGKSLVQRGNMIKNNYIHDILGIDGGTGAYGIYLDDMFAGMNIIGNIFSNVPVAVRVNGGRDNIVTNNIVVDQNFYSHDSFSMANHSPGTPFGDNTIAAAGGKVENTPLYCTLKEVDYLKEPYSSRYPEIQTVTVENALFPMNNLLENNAIINGISLTIDEKVRELSRIGPNFQSRVDPGFVDMENNNFQLKQDSSIYTALPNFKPIDFGSIGLYTSANRENVPNDFRILSNNPHNKNISTLDDITIKYNKITDFSKVNFKITDNDANSVQFNVETSVENPLTVKLKPIKQLNYDTEYTVSANDKSYTTTAKFATEKNPVNTVYFNDFNDNKLTGIRKIAGSNLGDYSIENKMLKLNSGSQWNNMMLMIDGSENLRDYTLSFDFKASTSSYTYPGFFTRYASDKQFYSGYQDVKRGQRTMLSADGATLATAGVTNFTNGKSYHIDIQSNGGKLQWWQDNLLICGVTNNMYPSGGCGVNNYLDIAYFDNIKLVDNNNSTFNFTTSNLKNLDLGDNIVLTFNKAINISAVDKNKIKIKDSNNSDVPYTLNTQNNNSIIITLPNSLKTSSKYTVEVSNTIATDSGINTPNNKFFTFSTTNSFMKIDTPHLKRGEETISNLSELRENDTVYATSTITNVDIPIKNAPLTLYTALLDSNGVLIQFAKSTENEIINGDIILTTPPINLAKNKFPAKIKIFIWNGENAPLTSAKLIK